jgi:hypothetical protein
MLDFTHVEDWQFNGFPRAQTLIVIVPIEPELFEENEVNKYVY